MSQGNQALVFKALDNFYFSELKVGVTRKSGKGLELNVGMEGHNPDLGNGIPFRFNITLAGQVENAMKESLLRGMMDPEAFMKKIEQYRR